jgi:hypothetical protein
MPVRLREYINSRRKYGAAFQYCRLQNVVTTSKTTIIESYTIYRLGPYSVHYYFSKMIPDFGRQRFKGLVQGVDPVVRQSNRPVEVVAECRELRS